MFHERFGFNKSIIEYFNDNYSESDTYILEEIKKPYESFEEYLNREGFENYRKHNISNLELKLCYAISVQESYHYIKKYCELGANPEAKIRVENPIAQLLDINEITPIEIAEGSYNDCAHYISDLLKNQNQKEYSILELINLFTYARHAQNYRLLKQYCS